MNRLITLLAICSAILFTGNASMDIEVDYVELPSEKLLGNRKFNTSSSAWQGVFSAMTPKQVQAVASEIVSTATSKQPI